MSEPVEILLVEDNPNDVELTLLGLKKYGFADHVQVVRDGEEALDFVFCTGRFANRRIEDCPKVILLDLKLPKVDGREVLRRAKGDPRTKSIPIVVLTSSRQESDVVECYELGANSYIVKPVDFERSGEVTRELGFYWLRLNQPPASRE